MEIEGKVAIVTGAGQGIGGGIALLFAKEGGKIAVADIKKEAADKTVEMIKKEAGEAISVAVDVTKISDVRTLVRRTVDEFGRIDILVNNAGIYPVTHLIDMKEEEWDRIIEVDLKSVFYCTKEVLPFMIKHKKGKIVNIASVTGAVQGYPGQTHYAAAKAGVLGFTRSLALELARYNINVNAVAPGVTETPGVDTNAFIKMAQTNPFKRFAKPLDIGNVALFLASERSNYVSGQLIVVDGGFSMQELQGQE
jgi:3-oxoacyl-[acyl-carrier protein] reductase